MRAALEKYEKERQLQEMLDENGMHEVSFDPYDDNYIDSEILHEAVLYELRIVNKRIEALDALHPQS